MPKGGTDTSWRTHSKRTPYLARLATQTGVSSMAPESSIPISACRRESRSPNRWPLNSAANFSTFSITRNSTIRAVTLAAADSAWSAPRELRASVSSARSFTGNARMFGIESDTVLRFVQLLLDKLRVPSALLPAQASYKRGGQFDLL